MIINKKLPPPGHKISVVVCLTEVGDSDRSAKILGPNQNNPSDGRKNIFQGRVRTVDTLALIKHMITFLQIPVLSQRLSAL